MKFKGEGQVNSVMGDYIAEFVNGEIETNDDYVIRVLKTKGFVPEPDTATPVAKKSGKE